MFKQKGNLGQAVHELKNDSNHALAHLYQKVEFGAGLLSQVVVTIKDLYATSDAPTQASSRILVGFEPGYDAAVVTKLRQAGAGIAAKIHMDELALGGSGEHSAWGKINNPLDSTRMPGGSSSGSVATFTQNIGLAIGSDTGNSVRLPASYCGLVGFKPSYGAVSRYGMFAFASSLDTVGWITHNVNDAIVASQALFGQDPRDLTTREVERPEVQLVKPERVAFLNDYGQLSPTVKKAYLDLQDKLNKDGVKTEVVNLEQETFELIDPTYEVISYSEASSNDANLAGVNFGQRIEGQDWSKMMLKTRSEYLGKMVQRRFTLGAYYLLRENQAEIFLRAQKVRRLIHDRYNKIFDHYDVLVFPTTTFAPTWESGKPNVWTSEYCAVSNLVGNPSVSIPFTREEGMPVGLLLDAKIYHDKKLLSHALYFEKLIGAKRD
ncbi:amidase family protein [Mycoplasma sp. ATU-Cv-703]|uniref:amidase family protein n=1 Tax=Mycoplasma sp. ATU-Cv-703 TaxID=2498595 RepID=UPI000FDE0774